MANTEVLEVMGGKPAVIDAGRATRAALAALFGPPEERDFAVRFWDGTVEPAGATAGAAFTLVLRHPGALRRMLVPPSELRAAEAFVNGDVDVDGDLEAATVLGRRLLDRLGSFRSLAWLAPRLLALPAAAGSRSSGRRAQHRLSTGLHTRPGDRRAVRFHYDVGNDFYRLWLDEGMVYSCAYFPTGAESLDTAQHAKLDYICRKLRLRGGERLLDLGCGWGGLLLHAARQYGVEAVGITLSQAQAGLARARIAARGLGSRCRVLVRDYRELSEESGFDKIASVGMFEHVGKVNLPAYFAQAFRLLRPGGLFLNHGIADLRPPISRGPAGWAKRLIWRPGAFIERYIFPGGKLVPPAHALATAEAAGFETRDVESLREHYALTLRSWLRRLEARRAEAAALVGEATCRAWRLYLAGCARQFALGRLGLIQALFAKTDRGRAVLPLSRADLYQ
jgi:cyclopropane-fatty-acyl-phospholipid synthase